MDFTPHTEAEIKEMLEVIGVSSIEDLFSVIPEEVRLREALKLPGPMSEDEVLRAAVAEASKNETVDSVVSFIGGGAYDHYVPAVVRYILSRGEFLTSYTPYQPEVAQGTLQAQFEYQTMVARVLGLDVANASMYEGSTSLAEAVLMARRYNRRRRVVVSAGVHPEYRAVLRTYVGPEDITEVPVTPSGSTDMSALEASCTSETAAVVVQNPNFFGVVEDVGKASQIAHAVSALSVVTFTEPLAYGLIAPPGETGADVAAGEGQSFGLPLAFGGPYIGLFAIRRFLLKLIPGRLVGMTVDRRGNTCYTLTLAAREQHIRRARAGSNICTNEGLCAVAVAVYLSLLGMSGFQRLALLNHRRCEQLKAMLAELPNVSFPFSGPTFNEFVISLEQKASAVVERLARDKVLPGLDLGRFDPNMANCLLVTVTERRTDADFERLVWALKQA